LKSGAAAAAAPAILVVIVIILVKPAAPEAAGHKKQSKLIQDVDIPSALAVRGDVMEHTLVLQVWVVNHM
jgi:hypothetical protein